MKAEETLQLMFDNYFIGVQTREMALIHLFCMYGTGFKWKNGELVNSDIDDLKKEDVILENGIAIQKKTVDDVALKDLYDCSISSNNEAGVDFKPVNFEIFKERFFSPDETKRFVTDESRERILVPFRKIYEDSKDTIINRLDSLMCREYSPIYHIPKDIKPDWNELYLETLDVLKEMNFSLDSEKIR